MPSVLRNRTYRRLFGAQVIALTGTGLATVALGLLAYDLAGADAGTVLGTALAIKMAAYVTVAPVIAAVADRLPRRALLVGSDLIRAGVAVFLPFVSQVWQVYVLIFLLQTASAAFTPTFQALIPDVLPDERDYTRALSMSRLAYDLESLFSPALAAALLSVITYDRLFLGTAAGFLASSVLVVSAALPRRARVSAPSGAGAYAKATAGTRLFLGVPQLRSLLAMNLAVAAAGAVVTVNSVVYVREFLGLSAESVALALGAYGAGSMAVALALPRILENRPDRRVMLTGALLLPVAFGALGVITSAHGGGWRWPALLATWAGFGAACSMVLTPAGRVLRRAAPEGDRTAVFAAQFSLSHAAWLLTYPLAGWVGAKAGLGWATAALGTIALAAAILAARLWPAAAGRVTEEKAPEGRAAEAGAGARGHVHEHEHRGLTPGHPHLRGARPAGAGWRHSHHHFTDDLHAAHG
ncbi:MFS transporter [Streptomyces sp. NBC_01264]|uniref:MFS transporter n=1 Tax=Streptomyces sp. NBC_01264 TaxID=2903804 RepID=UPI002255CC06|nr:MFS transporter [Streptomyces sp. NBC_01264]MCX4783507.1 MFS transporter [Streptomyces sp. NBC_01264]